MIFTRYIKLDPPQSTSTENDDKVLAVNVIFRYASVRSSLYSRPTKFMTSSGLVGLGVL